MVTSPDLLVISILHTYCPLAWTLQVDNHCLISPTVPSGPPTNIRIVHLESNQAEITWDTPHPAHINDMNGIKAYQVILNNTLTELTVNRSIVYFGLDPDTTYHVEVIPINSVGISERKHAGKFSFTTLTKCKS